MSATLCYCNIIVTQLLYLHHINMLRGIYSKVGVWKNANQVASHLASSCIVYKDHGLLAINKPSNLGISPTEHEVSLQDVIPELKRILRLEHLDYISSPEKFSTGLLLLGTEPGTISEVKKAVRRSRCMNLLDQTYLTLTDGVPRLNRKTEMIDCFRYVYPNDKKSVEPVLTRKLLSKKKLFNSKDVTRFSVYSETLSKSTLGEKSALVAVSPSRVTNHFIQLYMADLLSPVFGDFLYSYRVRRINGFSTKVSHTSPPPVKVQHLNPLILKTLGLKPGEEYILPKHLHKHQLILKKFIDKEKDLILRAPPPDFFIETAKALNISLDPINAIHQEHYKEPILRSRAN